MSSSYIDDSQYVQHGLCSCMYVCVMCVCTGSLGYEDTCLQGCIIYVHAHVYVVFHYIYRDGGPFLNPDVSQFQLV